MESVCTPLQSTALPTELKPGGGLSRHVQDSNLRGQSPMDFESNSLTARTTCLEENVTPWGVEPSEQSPRSARCENVHRLVQSTSSFGHYRTRTCAGKAQSISSRTP